MEKILYVMIMNFSDLTWKKDDTIVFNEDSLFKGAIAPIIYSSVELFDARLEFSTISYSDGAFNYSQTLYKTITVIQATCNNDTTLENLYSSKTKF